MIRKTISQFLTSIHKYYAVLIAGLYMAGLLIFGEAHPFSIYPMYNSFPNWSYSFYLTDENNELIPTQELGLSSADVGHLFYSICEDEKINYGDGKESAETLEHVGQKIVETLSRRPENKKYNSMSLHRIFFSYKEKKMVKIDKVIYEKDFK